MRSLTYVATPALMISLAVIAGCYDVPLPPESHISCTSNAECPPDLICRTEGGLNLCVPAVSDDTTAPSVRLVTITPAVARVGTTVTIDFETDEPLIVSPAVSLSVALGDRALALQERDGDTAWSAVYVASGDEGEGDRDVRATLIDLAGNVAADAPLDSIAFDFSAPTLADVTVEPRVAREGVEVLVTVRSNEPLVDAGTSAGVVDGRAFALDPTGADALVRTFRLTPSAAQDTEGDASLAIAGADAAGNVATRALESFVRFDFTPPALEGDAVAVRPIVTAGQVAVITMRTTEPVADAAVELVPADGGAALAMVRDADAGQDVLFRREIGVADLDGVYTARLVRLVDEAGNEALPVDLVTLIIDQNAPQFADAPVASPAVASRVPGHDLVSVAFTLSELSDVTVQLGDASVPCTSSGTAPSVAYLCERGIAIDDVEGVFGVSVTAIDPAGNFAFAAADGSVAFDFTEPGLVLGVVPDRAARAGEVIAIAAVPSEAIDPASVSFTPPPALDFAPIDASASIVTTSLRVEPGLEGTFDISFVVVDLGGNVSAPATRALEIDGVVPSLAAFTLSSTTVAPGEVFTLELLPSEELALPPIVTFANGDVDAGGAAIVIDMTLVSGPAADGSFLYEGTGPALGQNQFYTITVLLEDLAGNPGAESPAVIVVDNTPPVLAGFDIAPAAARDGDTVRVVVTATETLGAAPLIVARNGGASESLPPTSSAPGAISYVYTLPINAATAQGTWRFDAFQLRDAAGNIAGIGADPARAFAVDSVAPDVSNVALAPDRVRVGQTFTLSFNTSEPVATPNVTVAGTPMSLVSATGGTAFVFNYTATGVEPEGFLGVTISVSDAAGNVGVAGADVEMDFTPPALLSSSATPAVARTGSVITYSLTADEQLAAAPTLTVGGGAIPFAFSTGTAFIYTYTVTGAEPQGPRTVSAALRDLAGNTANVAGVGFAIDSLVPGITNLAVSPTHASLVAGHNVVTTSFNLSENVGAGLTVTVGGRAASCTNVALAFSCTLTVLLSDGAGTKSVVVQAADAAGNVALATGSVELDFTPPSLLSTLATPTAANAGDLVSYSLSASEPLAGGVAPTLNVGGPSPVAFSHVGGTQFSYTYSVTGAETSGARTVSTTLVDRAGNSASVNGVGFVIDVAAPVLSPINLGARPLMSLVPGFNSTVLSFTMTDAPTGSVPVVVLSVGGTTVSCTQAASTFTCPYAAVGTEPSAVTVVATATDAAGNVATRSSALAFDFVAPALLSSNVDPQNARAGAVVNYRISASEALVATPNPVVSGPSATPFAHVGGTTFAYRYTVTGAETSGTRTVQFTLTDPAGNSTTTAAAGFAIDVNAPVVSTLNLGLPAPATLSTRPGFNNTTITFTMTDAPAGSTPVVVLSVGAATVSCTQAASTFSCPFTASGAEPAAATVIAVVTDAAGNVTSSSSALAFDFAAPAIVGPVSLVLEPGTGTLNTTPTAVALGTAIRVGFTLSENTSAVPAVTTPATGVPFALLAQTGTTFVFRLPPLTGTPPQGASSVQLVATDRVGNTLNTTLTLPAPGVVIDTVRPAAPNVNTQDAVTFERAPWGDSTGVKRLRVVGAAGSAEANAFVVVLDVADVATAGELGRGATSGTGTFTANLGGVDRPEAFVVAMDGAGNVSDAVAGGAVQASRVRNVSWTASMGGKVRGSLFENPHTFESRTFMDAARSQPDGVEQGGAVIGTQNATSLSTTGQPAWEQVTAPELSFFGSPRMVYDEDRALTWMPGGPTGMMAWNGVRWNTAQVRDPEADGNPSLNDVRMVFDRGDGEVILFNQDGETWSWNGDSWRLRVLSANAGAFAPPVRAGHGMTWDDTNFVTVLFGGEEESAQAICEDDGNCLNDIWVFDSSAGEWFDFSSSPAPPPRTKMAFAYDFDSGVIVMHGGDNDDNSITKLNDTWIWDGSWTQLVTTPILARTQAAMVHDRFLGGLVMFGGSDDNGNALSEQLFFDGSDWSPSPPGDPELDGNPQRRADAGLVYDITRDEYVMYGGESDFFPNPCHSTGSSSCDDTWVGTAGSWRRVGAVTPLADVPTPFQGRVSGNMSFERTRGTTVLLSSDGGAGNDLYFFDGAAWKLQPAQVSPPIRRTGVAMAFDEPFGRTILFGGLPGNSATQCDELVAPAGVCNGTWVLNTTVSPATWVLRLPVTRPSKRGHAAMVYDDARDRMVLFGGQTNFGGSTFNGETWEWDTTSVNNGVWVLVCPAGACGNPPTPRGRHAMAYDRNRDVTVLFGGDIGAGASDNFVYEFGLVSGVRTWTRRTPSDPEGDGSPAGRINGTMIFDDVRQKVVYFGEDTNAACGGQPAIGACSDLWEWNGTSWRRIDAPASPSGDLRPVARTLHGMIHNPSRGESLMFGGDAGFDTWRLNGGGNARPAHVFHVDFRTAGAGDIGFVRDVALTWVVGGTASPNGTPLNGAQLLAFLNNRILLATSNGASSASPQSLTTTFTPNVFSVDQEMTFVAQPTQLSGNGAARGTVATDYAEARVRYRLP